MKIEDQVCSLEYAKRLKELGVKQESIFYLNSNEEIGFCYDFIKLRYYSSFTVSELGEMLPSFFKHEKIMNIIYVVKFSKSLKTNGYVVQYKPSRKVKAGLLHSYDVKEADARAKMLIHLIENKLIEVT